MALPASDDLLELQIRRLFALVAEALAAATDSLLACDYDRARSVVAGDAAIDALVAETDAMVWARIERGGYGPGQLRHLVHLLLILPELERSADLAEHVAQRAVENLGAVMTPVSRGIVQRMTEVALGMWRDAADAYADRSPRVRAVDQADEELDALHGRLTEEIAAEAMPVAVAAQVTLLARFYERLGDHAVNLTRRVAALRPPPSWSGPSGHAESH